MSFQLLLENWQGSSIPDRGGKIIPPVNSPIRTVIVSQGDVSDFHHLQGVVSDLIAVRIQDVCVFLSPPL